MQQTFREWFGDSKVIDGRGEPLRVFHGTQADFDTFGPDRQGETIYSEDEGFFFTNDPTEASAYATMDFGREAPQPNIRPVYLTIKNPKTIDLLPEQSPYDRPAIWYDNEGREAVAEAKAQGHDGLIIRDLREDVNGPINGMPLTLYVAFEPIQVKSAYYDA